MQLEIERKFLLKSDDWRSLGVPVLYQQGYLLISESKTIRIRTIGNCGYLTVKSAAKGLSRLEFEYEIPISDANSLMNHLCEKPLIKKYRTKIKIDDLVWEVDEFLDDNKGLIIAEIELQHEDQKFILPEWIGKEVTGNYCYNNSYLVKHPFNSWEK